MTNEVVTREEIISSRNASTLTTKIDVAERRKKVLHLRKMGYSNNDIAAQLKVSPNLVAKDVQLACRAIPKEEADDLRKIIAERLDDQVRYILDIEDYGDNPRELPSNLAKALVAIEERRAKMFGLDLQSPESIVAVQVNTTSTRGLWELIEPNDNSQG